MKKINKNVFNIKIIFEKLLYKTIKIVIIN